MHLGILSEQFGPHHVFLLPVASLLLGAPLVASNIMHSHVCGVCSCFHKLRFIYDYIVMRGTHIQTWHLLPDLGAGHVSVDMAWYIMLMIGYSLTSTRSMQLHTCHTRFKTVDQAGHTAVIICAPKAIAVFISRCLGVCTWKMNLNVRTWSRQACHSWARLFALWGVTFVSYSRHLLHHVKLVLHSMHHNISLLGRVPPTIKIVLSSWAIIIMF